VPTLQGRNGLPEMVFSLATRSTHKLYRPANLEPFANGPRLFPQCRALFQDRTQVFSVATAGGR